MRTKTRRVLSKTSITTSAAYLSRTNLLAARATKMSRRTMVHSISKSSSKTKKTMRGSTETTGVRCLPARLV